MGGEDRPGGELPRSLELLWRRADRGRRAPRQALSLERIVSAAIEIADVDGIAALSMARLAEKLGCAPMSLYRHVASKDELQVFMMDTAPGPPPALDASKGDWRAGLERWARELRAVYFQHPWVLQITGSSPPLEPGQLAWLDCGLGVLRGTRLRPAQRLSVVMLLLYYVRGEAQLAVARAHPGGPHDDAESMAAYGNMLARLVEPERFPALAELVAAGGFDPGPSDGGADPEFDFGLARVLDGIEQLVDAARR